MRRHVVQAVIVATLVAALGGLGWWLAGSPLELVTALSGQGPLPTAHGRWLVREHQTETPGSTTLDLMTTHTTTPIGGGPTRRLPLPAGLAFCFAAGVTDTDAYYTIAKRRGRDMDYSIYRAPLDGGPGKALVPPAGFGGVRGNLVVMGGRVYYLAAGSALPPAAGGRRRSVLCSVSVDGGPVQRVLEGPGSWVELRPDDTGFTIYALEAVREEVPRQFRTTLHHYALADGRHTEWRGLSPHDQAGSAIVWRGRYYWVEDLNLRPGPGAGTFVRTPDTPASARLVSCALDGADRRVVLERRSAKGEPTQVPEQVLSHRGHLLLLQRGSAGAQWALFEVIPRARRADLRRLAALPSGVAYTAYCDGSYCYLQSMPDGSLPARRVPGWLPRFLQGSNPQPALYRVRLPQ